MSANPLLSAPLSHAGRGWRVVPCHSAPGGRCSCGKYPCGTGNKHAGKHPRTQHGHHDATADEQQIQTWARQYPGCNWGVATGRDSGVFVLDVDGERGRASLATLEAQHGPLPATLTSRTGRADRGEHRYFSCPEGVTIRNSTGTLVDGLDVRGDGGHAIIPPSVHESGRAYEWIDPDATIADAPPWLLEMVTGGRSKIGPEANQTIPQGRRNVTLTSRAGRMRRRGMTQEEIEAAQLAENASCCRPPLPEDEVRGIARSVSRYEPAPRPNARQPLRDFLLSARDKNNLDFICRSKWMSSMFVFARLLKGRAEFARMAGLEAVQRIEQELENPWELFADICDDPRAQLVADWDKVHTAASDDTLNRAWCQAQQSPVLPPHVYSDKYCQFISLVAALQRIVGAGVPIGLPLKRIGELLGCHWTMVSKYRKWAVEDGLLQESAQYVRHQRAAEYLFDLSKVVPVSPEPVSPDSHTSTLTRATRPTRPTNDLVRTHIASGENQITSGENAPSEVPAGTASDPGYVDLMSTAELIDSVKRAGGVLELHGDKVKCHLPRDAAKFVELLRERKPELIDILRARGGRIATFPHCPRCASFALYRTNNIGSYECETCGLRDMDPAAARRTH